MDGFEIHRIGIIMKPKPGNKMENEGVLNPAAIRGPDGDLYLFPRLVAKDNYSRIGIAKVIFNKKGDPESVIRLGVALEPEADYEKGLKVAVAKTHESHFLSHYKNTSWPIPHFLIKDHGSLWLPRKICCIGNGLVWLLSQTINTSSLTIITTRMLVYSQEQ